MPMGGRSPCGYRRLVRVAVPEFRRSIIALIAAWIFTAACVTSALAVPQKVEMTKGTPEVSEELRVVLERADYVGTVRLQATYLFRVTERVHETFGFHPHGFPPPPGSDPDTFSLRLSQGSDVDDTGRDSIDRLNWLFDAGALDPRAGLGSPMTIGNTNCVTLRVFGSIWLFSDTPGRGIAIDYSRKNRQWGSRHIIELFGGPEPAPFIYLSRYIDGRSMTLLEHKELEVRLAAIHALPAQSEDAMEHLRALLQDNELEVRLAAIRVLPTQGKAAIDPLLEHFCLHARLRCGAWALRTGLRSPSGSRCLVRVAVPEFRR
jgi:hypothetical protein